MPYVNVTGTNGNNFLAFVGEQQFFNGTLVNPYSGYSINISDYMNVNNGIYDGRGGTDTLSMTSMGDLLELVDANGTIMIKNVEIISAGDDGDIVNLAHSTVTYGNVTIRGSNGNDIIWSNLGNDVLQGGAGNDIMDGGGGNDTLSGGFDDDYLDGGSGEDKLYGGAGNDTLVYHADSIWGVGTTLASLGSSIKNSAILLTLEGYNRSLDSFHGDMDETLTTHDNGIDTIVMTVGNDVIVAGNTDMSGIDVIDAGTGNDVVDLSSATNIGPVTISGGSGDDLVAGGNNNDHIDGGADNDILFGMGGNDTLLGGDGDDVLYGDDGKLIHSIWDKTFSDSTILPRLEEGVDIVTVRPSSSPAIGISDGNLTIDQGATATLTFRKGYSGYDSSLGMFAVAADGTIMNTSMLWKNVKTAGIDVDHTIDIPVGVDGGSFGFFIIANGNNANGGYNGINVTGDGLLSFIYHYGQSDQRAAKVTDSNADVALVYNDGSTVRILNGNMYMTTERGASSAINEDGKAHIISGISTGAHIYLDPKNADISTRPNSFTKNGMTVEALDGNLITGGDRIGIQTSVDGGNTIGGNEALKVTLDQGAEKIVVSLSDIAGNSDIALKIFMNGSATPIDYNYHTGNIPNGILDIVLTAEDFGAGFITGIQMSSGTETFWLNNILAIVTDANESNVLRIGFEDLYNLGDSDYEDVLFDIDIHQVVNRDEEGGNDILDGGAGNDTLYGEGGNDILIFGLGADQLYGGTGADTFAMTLVDGLVDKIYDFNAAEGDVINIHDVLQGYDPLSDDIANFVRLVQSGSDTAIQINADGEGAFVTATLIMGGVGGVDLATLINNGSLVADHGAIA